MLNPRKLLLASLLGALILIEISCASSGKNSGDAVLHRLQRIILRNLHARRPLGPGANPNAVPGGKDYTSLPLPDRSLDCKPLRELYARERLASIRECLKSVGSGEVVHFRVRLRAEPFLELEPSEDNEHPVPACMKDLLSRVIVPREIFFQSAEEGTLECYSSRLPVESDEVPVLGVKWPLSRTRVEVSFPLPVTPENDEQTLTLLETWALAPYFDWDAQRIAAKVMDENLCRTCMGEENLYREPDRPAPLHWPE